MNSSRLSWFEYFLEIADTVSIRADCTRRKCGAVLVDSHNRIISTGYNGAPPGAYGCLTDNACPRGQMSYDEIKAFSSYANCSAIHAEKNALLFCDPSKRKGSTLFVNQPPCPDCRIFAAACGVKMIVWYNSEGNISSMKLYH
jgi:dCMP deaminase